MHMRLSAEADRLKALAARKEELRREAELKSPLLARYTTLLDDDVVHVMVSVCLLVVC